SLQVISAAAIEAAHGTGGLQLDGFGMIGQGSIVVDAVVEEERSRRISVGVPGIIRDSRSEESHGLIQGHNIVLDKPGGHADLPDPHSFSLFSLDSRDGLDEAMSRVLLSIRCDDLHGNVDSLGNDALADERSARLSLIVI